MILYGRLRIFAALVSSLEALNSIVQGAWPRALGLPPRASNETVQGSNDLARAANIPNALHIKPRYCYISVTLLGSPCTLTCIYFEFESGCTGPQISFEPGPGGPFVIRTPVISKLRLSIITSHASKCLCCHSETLLGEYGLQMSPTWGNIYLSCGKLIRICLQVCRLKIRILMFGTLIFQVCFWVNRLLIGPDIVHVGLPTWNPEIA